VTASPGHLRDHRRETQDLPGLVTRSQMVIVFAIELRHAGIKPIKKRIRSALRRSSSTG
jgi:hypothetical protein